MLLSSIETKKRGYVSSCRGCLGAVEVVEDLRNQIKRLSSDLERAREEHVESAPVAIAPTPPPVPEDEGDINRKSWNRAIRAAAAEAAHEGYNKDGEGLNLRIADAIMDLRR